MHLYNSFLENKDSENCAQLIEEEFYKMFDLNDEHDCNVVSMHSMNIHDANDMQSHKIEDAMFDEDESFSPPRFDVEICYNDCMPPIYDDYCDDMYAIKNNDHVFNVQFDHVNQVSHDSYFVEFAPTIDEKKFSCVESNKFSMFVDHEKNALCDGYIVEFIDDATENYYERGSYACSCCNNIKFPLYVLKALKLCLFCLPMLVDSCYHKLFAHKIPMHRKWVRLKFACHIIHDDLFMFQFFILMRASLKSSCLAKRH
jgi:hypothetical protein